MASDRITGLTAAKAAFKALPEVTRDRLNHATDLTRREIERAAKGRLLASPSIQTRNLLNSITSTMSAATGLGRVGVSAGSTMISGKRVKGIVTAGKGGSALKAAGARLDKPSRRAHFVEFGTEKMSAEPFMLPAADAQKPHYLARCRAAGKQIESDLAHIGGRLL